MPKRVITKTAFNWMADAWGPEYGKRAASAFACTMRHEACKNCLHSGEATGDGAPYVICGDDRLEDWMVTETFENLLSQYIHSALDYGEPEKLTELLAVLQKATTKAERARKHFPT